MGVRKCIIEGCASSTAREEDRGVTFHKIPENKEIAEKWVTECRLAHKVNYTKTTQICSRHFRKADFADFKGKKYVLKKTAVPSIFTWKKDKKETPESPIKKETPEQEKPPDNSEKPVVNEEIKKEEVKKEEKAKRPAEEATVSGSEQPKKIAKRDGSASPTKKKSTSTPKRSGNQSPIGFLVGDKIEAQDYSGKWLSAKVSEVDQEEREVFIQYEKSGKTKQAINDEWISMDSVRLRKVSTPKMPQISQIKYLVGEQVLARWSDSRKFKATIQNILENDIYEVIFDDGFIKNVKGIHISKKKEDVTTPGRDPSASLAAIIASPPPPQIAQSAPTIQPYLDPMPDLKTLPEIPKDGEWCCHWLDDYPIGEQSCVEFTNGKILSTKVDDWRLPLGWQRHFYWRISTYGKMDVILVSSSGRKFKSKSEVKQFLAEIGEQYDSNTYDFSLHKKRSKELKFFKYSQEYKKSLLPESLRIGESPLNKIASETVNDVINVGALKVKIVNNLYECPEETCKKTFRNQNHLQIHIKHYHREMAKDLGVCPNMTDLAALRSTVEEIEPQIKTAVRKSLPSSTISKSAWKQDNAEKSSKKLNKSVSEVKSDKKIDLTVIKTEIKDEKMTLDDTISDSEPFQGFNDTTLVGDEIMEDKKPKVEPEDPVVGDMVDPEALIATHSLNKTTLKNKKTEIQLKLFASNKKRELAKKRSRQRAPFCNRKRKKPKRKIPKVIGDHFMDTEETQLSFGGAASNMNIGEASSSKILSSTIDNFMETSQTTINSTMGQYGDDSVNAVVDSPQYIIENGEYIKIVRMKKEEIINCLCGYGVEDGLMVQCELCLCWQHGICNGFEKDSQVPDTYICYICRNPQRGRASMKYINDQDWLYDGKLPVANYHVPSPRHNARFQMLKNSHTLAGNLVELKRFLHSLNVKINIAEKKDHPKMYLWSKKWESSPPAIRGGNGDFSSIVSLNKLQAKNVKEEIKTEIKTEGEIKKENESGGSLLATLLQSPIESKVIVPNIPQPEAAIDSAECQVVLLEHIQRQQNHAMSRLQAIETQIMALEACDEKSEQIELANLNNNYPKTKQTIRMLLNDLSKMRNIASIHQMVTPSYPATGF